MGRFVGGMQGQSVSHAGEMKVKWSFMSLVFDGKILLLAVGGCRGILHKYYVQMFFKWLHILTVPVLNSLSLLYLLSLNTKRGFYQIDEL